MGIIDKINGGFRAAREFLFGTKPSANVSESFASVTANAYSNPRYRRSTTATRRFQRDANREYSHVSMPINEHDQRQVQWFGFDFWRSVLRTDERAGETYDMGINAEKRRLRALGYSKRGTKQMLRSFRAQLRAQGVK